MKLEAEAGRKQGKTRFQAGNGSISIVFITLVGIVSEVKYQQCAEEKRSRLFK